MHKPKHPTTAVSDENKSDMPVPVIPPATVFYLQNPSIRHLFFARQMESELAEWYQGQAVFFDKTHPDHATVISVSMVILYAIFHCNQKLR